MASDDTVEELSPREQDVLAAVGRRLSNAEIAAELYISVRTVESHIAALRRKLVVDSRAGLVAAAGRRHRRRGPVVHRPQNSFVGRDDDLVGLRVLLGRDRWVTVVGPAGAGKTRLALEVAAAADRTAVVVELEHVAADTLATVTGAVADALGLGMESGAGLVAACARVLEVEPHLLVLDDGDRVTGGAAELVRALLARVPDLVVLATSRSPLGGSDETIYPLDPLPVVVVDDTDADTDVAGAGADADAAGAPAIRLFFDRARAAAPTTAPEAAGPDLAAAARICRRLDGLPLAIELAAARVRHIPVGDLADLLDDGLQVLDRAGPASRHRTLEAAFAWTWELLDADEQLVLSQLAALPRPFDLPLAEAVTRPGGAGVVVRLLDRSLLANTVGPGDPRRFRLFESLRAFVLDRAEGATVEAARLAHAELFAERVGRVAAQVRTDDSRALVDEGKRLAPDAAAALRWATSQATRPALAASLARSLAVLASHGGPDADSLAAIAGAARDPGIRSAASVDDLFELGRALFYGDLALVDDLVEHAMTVARDDAGHLAAHHLAGWADAYRGRTASAGAHLATAEALALAAGDSWQLASIRQAQGVVRQRSHPDDPDGAFALFEAAARGYAQAGDEMLVNNCRYMMAGAAADGGRRDEALALVERCAAQARATGNDHELAHVTLIGARLADAGADTPDADADDADDPVHEAIGVFRASGDLRCLTRSYLLLADRHGHPDRERWLEQALAVARDADDRAHQATALQGLVAAHRATGDGDRAARALTALVELVGEDEARRLSPTTD